MRDVRNLDDRLFFQRIAPKLAEREMTKTSTISTQIYGVSRASAHPNLRDFYLPTCGLLDRTLDRTYEKAHLVLSLLN